MSSAKGRELYKCLILCCFLLSTVVLSACTRSNSVEDAEQVLVRSVVSEPDSLDPHKYRQVQADIVLRDIGEGLVGYSPNGKIVPLGASRWTVSDDALQYTFYLREAARWSNGDPVIADHYVYAFRRLFDPSTASPSAGDANAIRNSKGVIEGVNAPAEIAVRAEDSYTLVIELESPTPYFLQLLTEVSMYPLHPQSVAEHGTNFVRPGNHLSNGAYRLIGVGPKYTTLELERNDYYWDNESTFFDKVRWTTISDDALLSAYRAGDVDFTDHVPVQSYSIASSQFPEQLRISPGFTLYFYGFNLALPPLEGNVKLRQALSMAIDRETLVNKVLGRGEIPAYSLVPPGVEGYERQLYGFSSKPQRERVEAARQLYRQAGYSLDNPVSFELRYNTAADHERIALAIQAMWKETLGANVELVNEEFGVIISNLQAKDVMQVFRLGWTGDYLDAQAFLKIFETNDPNNFYNYSSATFDALMRQASSEPDLEKRNKLLAEAEKVSMEAYPLIPIYFLVTKHLVSPDILGFEENSVDIHYSKNLKRATYDNN